MAPSDPTIPRHGRQRSRTMTSGWFVDYGDRVVLRDRWGNTWARESVTLMQGMFGFNDDGARKAPRPYKYDARGEIEVEGDQVVIDFLDGNPKLPVVLGCVVGPKEGFLPRGFQDDTAPYNRLAVRLRALDAAGEVVGEIRFDTHGAAGAGVASFQATKTLELLIAEDLDDTSRGYLRLTMTDGTVVIDVGGDAQPVILGISFLTDLKTWLDAIDTLVLACGSATTAPQIATAFSTFAPFHSSFKVNVGSSVSLEGAPYLSEVTKTE